MAKFEFKLPDIGEGVTEGEIVSWLVKAGDEVTEDQEMVEVMTDKATVTIGAPKAGRVAQLHGEEGEVVPVGHVLVVLDLNGAGGSALQSEGAGSAQGGAARAEAPGGGVAATAVGDIHDALPEMAAIARSAQSSSGVGSNQKPLAAPATRKLARELGIDLSAVQPSGPGGRITRDDVEKHGQAAVAAVAIPSAPSAPAPLAPPQPIAAASQDQHIPIRGMRRRIYENMARSKRTAAHFTYVDECETTALRELRQKTRGHVEAAGGKLTFLPFIVKAVVAALKHHSALNCLIDDAKQEIIQRGTYNIGIATSTDAGLIVPVLRNADRLSIVQITQEIGRLSALARSGKIAKEDLGGSSFTITSLGKLGGLFATPVINYPEVAILGIHEMKKRPIVRDDEIVIGEVMLLSLSFDHRVIDGHVGAGFAQSIISYLQEPERLICEM